MKKNIICEEITALKQTGNDNSKDIFAGSPELIKIILKLNLIDE